MKKYQIIAIIHWIVLFLVGLSNVFCWIYEPWYLCIIVSGACFRFILSSEKCPITEWEDKARIKAGVEPTDGKFLKFYILKLKRLFNAN